MCSSKLLTGEDWRLGHDPNAEIFGGLVGGDRWAIELTHQEFKDFCRLSIQLGETIAAIAEELADRENVTCVVETADLQLEATGFPDSFSLNLQIWTGRRAEGRWQAESVPELLEAVRRLSQLLS
jgi:hypothetical protein